MFQHAVKQGSTNAIVQVLEPRCVQSLNYKPRILLFLSPPELAFLGVGSAGSPVLGIFLWFLWRARSPVAFVRQADGGKPAGVGVGV